jgi:hypothetical protein
MANIDRPRGAVPIRNLDGTTNFQITEYTVDSSNGTAIFIGDFVDMEADGNISPAAAGTGVELLGVVAYIKDGYDNLSTRHLAVSTAGTVGVYDSPYTIFSVQEDDGGTSVTATGRGTNVAIIAGAGDATTGTSRHEFDQDSIVATTEQLRLLRLVPVENNAYGDNAEWEVLINEHEYKDTVGT